MNWILSLWRSFGHAWRGLRLAFRTEQSFRLQLAIAIGILYLCLVLPLRAWERAILVLAIACVLVLELLNSTVERLVDLVKPRLHSYVHDIKDLMAAAVLLAALFAALVGGVILWPYLMSFVTRL